MKEIWDRLIERADLLASERPESAELLAFYSALLRSQKQVYEYLRSQRGSQTGSQKDWLPSGAIEQDLAALRVMFISLLRTVESNAPDALSSQAQSLLETNNNERDQLLIEYWRAPSDLQ